MQGIHQTILLNNIRKPDVIDFMKAYLYYIPTAVVVSFIMYATFAAHPALADEVPPIPYVDKYIHAIMMGGLLSAFAFDWQRANPDKRVTPAFVWAVFACVFAFSAFDELFQGLLCNGRSADPYDLIADTVGAIGAAYLAPPAIRRVLKIK